jgi:DNA-directed RNA polymerase beta' subunit
MWIPIIIAIALFLVVIYLIKKWNTNKTTINTLRLQVLNTVESYSKIEQAYEQANNKLLYQHIQQALSQMDKTCKYYMDEDEANRELCTCLNLLGHNAVYHSTINNRTVDIYLDNVIIEGKLDPKQSDIDRLIGQIADYVTFGKNIYIVIYGQVSPSLVERIRQQIILRYNSVYLLYLDNPNRVKATAIEVLIK